MKDFLKKYGEDMRKEISKEDYDKLYPGMAEMFKQPSLTFQAGQVGYEEYSRHTGGKSLATGAPLPQWDDLPDNIKYAWEASAYAIIIFLQNKSLTT